MEEEKFIDNSGDKKYFSIIPNYIVNHSTHWEKSLYLTLKRITGERGSCWKSPDRLAKLEDCSANKIRDTLKSLEKRGWIKKIGIKGKTKPTNEYIIVDLWDKNNDFYNKKDYSPDEQSKRKFTQCRKKVHPVKIESSLGGMKEEPLKKTNKEDNTKVLVKTEYGNPDINKIVFHLKEKFGLKVLDGSVKSNRQYANLLVKKVGGSENLKGLLALIDFAAKDDWWSNKITSVKDLYYNIVKIHQQVKSRKPITVKIIS